MELTEWDSQENSAHTPTYNPHILTLKEKIKRFSWKGGNEVKKCTYISLKTM